MFVVFSHIVFADALSMNVFARPTFFFCRISASVIWFLHFEPKGVQIFTSFLFLGGWVYNLLINQRRGQIQL